MNNMNENEKQNTKKATNKTSKKVTKKATKNIFNSPVTIACGSIVLAAISVWLYFDTMNVGSRALTEAYNANYEIQKENARKQVYDCVYNFAENEYHVSNRVNIEIGDLQEVAYLEVLHVNDDEYIIDNGSDNESHAVCWAEFPGEAIFTVNLKASEFIIDNARGYILVRAPYPEIKDIKVKAANKLLFEDEWLNGTYSQGEAMAQKQMQEAKILITKEFLSNQFFYINAQEAAKRQIVKFVERMNPDVENLTVEVEFF